jgi:enoyl-CoA hydratase/carnithine racemase
MRAMSPAEPLVSPLVAARQDGVLLLRLHNPGRRNALTEPMRLALIAALAEAEADPATLAVVLTGAEGAFCAGQDRAVLRALDSRNVEAWVRGLGDLYDSLRRFPKPCVAAIPGAAAGAGLQMALCCDRRIATAAARLLQPEVKAGVASIMGPFLIGLHAGLGANQRLSLACEAMEAGAALAAGLLDEIAPEPELIPRALAAARAMAAADPTAFRETKLWMREMTEAGFRAAIETGVRAQARAVASGAIQRALGG